MTESDYRVARFDGAVTLLPFNLRERVRELLRADREEAEELRLRVGRPLSAVLPAGERELGREKVTLRVISHLVEICTGASVHSSSEEIREGYISCRGGYRVGLGGSVYLCEGGVGGFHCYSYAAIRISRERRGVAETVLGRLTPGDKFCSTLIIAPPGAGKTTLLRDLVRTLSQGTRTLRPRRVSLADERGEVAAMWAGQPQFDVGPRTDVLEGCPKAQAVMMLLRSMNPEVIALDEITAPEDAEAIRRAQNCGVRLLATAHGEGLEDLTRRPLYRGLFESHVFQRCVIIKNAQGRREYEVASC